MVMELVEGNHSERICAEKGKLSSKGSDQYYNSDVYWYWGSSQSSHHHRDIKPQNIIISKEGKVKVTDFWYCKGDNIADSQHQCNGIGTLCISGAGTGRLL